MARGAAFTTSLAFHAAALALVVLVPLFGPEPLPDAERPTPPLQLWPATPTLVRADSRPPSGPARPGSSGARRMSLSRRRARPSPPSLPPQAESAVLSQGPRAAAPGREPARSRAEAVTAFSRAASPGADRVRPRAAANHAAWAASCSRPPRCFTSSPSIRPLARVARVRGTVVLECTIDPAGNVIDVRVLSGHPLLAPAAVLAVGRWRYSPTRLNGQPVSVLLTVTVRFDLAP